MRRSTVLLCAPISKAPAPKKPGEDQAIGRSRGGLSTKIHTLVNALGNPLGFFLTGGEAHDLVGADHLLPTIAADMLIADKAFDADERVLAPLAAAGKTAVIPPRANRSSLRDYNRPLYGARHLIENFLSPTQLIGEVREPIPTAPCQSERYDCEYRRNGTANLFVFIDAHKSWRHVKVTDHRTARDVADCVRDLADIHYPEADRIRVVLDNLSTHTAGALYEAFPAPEAHRVL